MNAIRRKQLREVIEQIESIMGDFECIKDEKEEYRDNIPENMQGGTRYEKAEEVCDYLDEAYANLEDAINNIEGAIE